MEFPNLGERCTWPECETLDFLPLTCSYCKQVFCKNHFNQDLHKCESFQIEISEQAPTKSFICSIKDCNTHNPLEMLCIKCNKHYCLSHRYHNCFDVVEDIELKKRLWNEPREQFAESVKNAQNTVNEKIKKAIQDPKKYATAIKIQLMRLKGKAEGALSIPNTDRVYFLILLPKGSKKSSKAVFVSQEWSVGRVIDAVADICKVINKNNEMNAPKLRLFKANNGVQISSEINIKISELITASSLVNGETLILEYVKSDQDLQSFALSDFSEYNDSF